MDRQGRRYDYLKGGSHCVKQRVLTSFCRLNIVGCMLKKAYKRERWGLRAPQTPLATTLSLV